MHMTSSRQASRPIMSMSPLIPHRDLRKITIQLHRWLSVGAALFWMIQAITGTLLSFHFELEDIFVSTQHQRTDLEAIEDTIDEIAAAGPDAQVYWIWTSAGLPDRYVILASDDEKIVRRIRIDGAGDIQRDRAADEHSFLGQATFRPIKRLVTSRTPETAKIQCPTAPDNSERWICRIRPRKECSSA
ncbi:MAG: PepSY-associated TM helix domain-containing protein, partial [Pseudomonadota bacterium]